MSRSMSTITGATGATTARPGPTTVSDPLRPRAWSPAIEALAGYGAIATRPGPRRGLTESGAQRREAIVERLQIAAARGR